MAANRAVWGIDLGQCALKAVCLQVVDKKVEVVGTSADSYAQATRNAVAKAAESLHNLEWFEVKELRGRIRDGKVDQFQVTLKIGFKLD